MIIVIITDKTIIGITIFIISCFVRVMGMYIKNEILITVADLGIILGGGIVLVDSTTHTIFYNFGNQNVHFTTGGL